MTTHQARPSFSPCQGLRSFLVPGTPTPSSSSPHCPSAAAIPLHRAEQSAVWLQGIGSAGVVARGPCVLIPLIPPALPAAKSRLARRARIGRRACRPRRGDPRRHAGGSQGGLFGGARRGGDRSTRRLRGRSGHRAEGCRAQWRSCRGRRPSSGPALAWRRRRRHRRRPARTSPRKHLDAALDGGRRARAQLRTGCSSNRHHIARRSCPGIELQRAVRRRLGGATRGHRGHLARRPGAAQRRRHRRRSRAGAGARRRRPYPRGGSGYAARSI